MKNANFFFKKVTKEFFIGQETYSIVFCSTRDTSPLDLCIMTLPVVSFCCDTLYQTASKSCKIQAYIAYQKGPSSIAFDRFFFSDCHPTDKNISIRQRYEIDFSCENCLTSSGLKRMKK